MFPNVHLADTSTTRLGRVTAGVLPQEYQLAKLIQNISNPRPSWSAQIHACNWHGVTCVDQRVREISWSANPFGYSPPLSGSLDVIHLPDSVTKFFVSHQGLKGEVTLGHLPPTLSDISVWNNLFSASLDLPALPPSMRQVDMGKNKFVGNICLSELPVEIEKLDLCHNSLTGGLELNALPHGMQILSLHHNLFSGLIDFMHLPRSLFCLDVRCNEALCAEVKRSELPQHVIDNPFRLLSTNIVLIN